MVERTGARGMDGREWLLLLFLSALWGSSFFFYKVMDAAWPPLTIAFGRIGIAALVMNGLLALRGQALGRTAPWGRFALLGTINCAIPFTLFAWGETQVTSGMAAVLNATTPLFAVLLAHAAGTERMTWSSGAGVAFGLTGVAVLVGPDGLAFGGAQLAGQAACLLAAFSYGVAGQYARRLRHLPSLQVATGQLTGAALVLLPSAALADRFWEVPAPGLAAWGALGGIALGGTALAYMLYFRLLATAGATSAQLVTFLLPVSALLIGWLCLREAVPPRAYAGMALIGLGLAAIDGRLGPLLTRLRGTTLSSAPPT